MEQDKEWIRKELNMCLLMNQIEKRDKLLIEEYDRKKKEKNVKKEQKSKN